MMTEEEEDTRPEDWYAKDSDLWVLGGIAFIPTMVLTAIWHNNYKWYVTALFAYVFWWLLTRSLIDSAYRIRRRKDAKGKREETE
jgi:hypothetical protein